MRDLSMKHTIILLGICFFFYALPCNGADSIKIQWDDLIPKLPPVENPMEASSKEEKEFIEWIIYLREYLPEEIAPGDQDLYEEMNEALPRLKKEGIDVEQIIADRQLMNSAVNTDLNGRQVTISGYLLPLDLSNNKIKDFLLVPYVGACIHVPPPPPNQIIHAVSEVPTRYKVDKLYELYEPVTVTGKLEVQSLSKDLFLLDGSSNVTIGYSIAIEKIEDYKP